MFVAGRREEGGRRRRGEEKAVGGVPRKEGNQFLQVSYRVFVVNLMYVM